MGATESIIKRFESKYVEGDSGCWLWTGRIEDTGYGRLYWKSTKFLAHRWSYEHFIGAIPEGLVIDHLCRVRECVNPEHLEVVTQKENLNRGIPGGHWRGKRTHCKHGHEYNKENTSIAPQGHRICKVCKRKDAEKFRSR